MFTKNMGTETREKFDYDLDPVRGEELRLAKIQANRNLLFKQFSPSQKTPEES